MIVRSLPLVAVLLLVSATAGAQQALVPATTAQPGWPETSRTAQIIRQQLRPAPGAAQAPLGGAEAERIYQNYLGRIGKPASSENGYSSNSGFGSNAMSSGYGSQQ
jgi:hypothetical protein